MAEDDFRTKVEDHDKQLRDHDKRIENNKHNVRYFWIGFAAVAGGIAIASGTIWWQIPGMIEQEVKRQIADQTAAQYIEEIKSYRDQAARVSQELAQVLQESNQIVSELRAKQAEGHRFTDMADVAKENQQWIQNNGVTLIKSASALTDAWKNQQISLMDLSNMIDYEQRRITLRNSQGEPAVILEVDDNGNGRIMVNDGKIAIRVTDHDQGSIWLQNQDGKYVTRVGTEVDGKGRVEVRSKDDWFPPNGSPEARQYQLVGPSRSQ